MAHPLVVALMKKKGLTPLSDPAIDDSEGASESGDGAEGDGAAPNEKVTPELISCAADVLDAKDPESLASALADFIDMYQGGPESGEPAGEDEAGGGDESESPEG